MFFILTILKHNLTIIEMTTETVDDVPYVPVSSSVTAPSIVKEPASVAIPVNHAERPEKFNGQNFNRWQQKMFFYLTTLNLARFLTEDAPKPKRVKQIFKLQVQLMHGIIQIFCVKIM